MTRQEVLEKYSGTVEITSKEFEELLHSLMLVSDNSKRNSQILCHGAGAKGIESLDEILNVSGLSIKRTDPDSNNYVAEGLLSTNVCFNSPTSNDVDVENAFGYKYGYSDPNGNFYTIVSAVPLAIGDITLGRIIKQSKDRNCVLDDLGIEKLPKEFILGVLVNDGKSRISKFTLNSNFFMLSRENYNKAYDSVKQILKNANYEDAEEYYSRINAMMKMVSIRKEAGLPVTEFMEPKEYQKDALSLHLKIRDDKNFLDQKNANPLKKGR